MAEHVTMGWVCPQCNRVWAPHVRECEQCRRTAELIARDAAAAPAAPQPPLWTQTMTATHLYWTDDGWVEMRSDEAEPG